MGRRKRKWKLAHEKAKGLNTMIWVYGLIDPVSDQVRYVGQSNHPERRYVQHLRRAVADNRKSPHYEWIRGLMGAEQLPSVRVLRCVPRLQGVQAEVEEQYRHRCTVFIRRVPTVRDIKRAAKSLPVSSGATCYREATPDWVFRRLEPAAAVMGVDPGALTDSAMERLREMRAHQIQVRDDL